MEEKYNLIKGKITVNNEVISLNNGSLWKNYKGKIFSLVAAMYIYDRIALNLEKELTTFKFSFIIIIYGSLSLLVIYLLYDSWIKETWVNKLNIQNISKVTITEDEDNSLNSEVKIKGIFNTLNLTFRNTEPDLDNFINHLQRLNSTLKIKHERI